MQIRGDSLCVGQVFEETEDFLTLKIPKRDDVEFTLGEVPQKDRFFTLIFIKREDDGTAVIWKPWKEE